MTTSPYEQNVAILARDDVNIYDYYFTANSSIVKTTSKEALFIETFSQLNDFFNIDTQAQNLQNLLNRVISLNAKEAHFDQDTRNRMCHLVWSKFQKNIEKQKDMLEKKKQEIAFRRDEFMKKVENNKSALFQKLIERNAQLNAKILAEISAIESLINNAHT